MASKVSTLVSAQEQSGLVTSGSMLKTTLRWETCSTLSLGERLGVASGMPFVIATTTTFRRWRNANISRSTSELLQSK